MSIFSKGALSSFFGLSDDEYEDYVAPQSKPALVNVSSTSAQGGRPSDRYRTEPPVRETRQQTRPQPTTRTEQPKEEKVVSIRSNHMKKEVKAPTVSNNNKIRIIEPRVYSEAMNIAKYILANEAVLVNFHLVEEPQARRIVDFLTGTVYAMDGDIQRVGDEIFLCTPTSVEIDGAARSLVDEQMFDLN
jgi:Uncharacterized protein conserved in bacteria